MTTKEEMFQKVREAAKLIEEAKQIAAWIGEYEGMYYSSDNSTLDVLERYFEYHTDKDVEEFWYSSKATC